MRPRLAAFALALLLAACGKDPDPGGAGGGAAQPRGFTGRFQGEGPAGPITLTLKQTGDVVEIEGGGEKLVGRLVGPNRVETSTREANLTAHGAFTLDGDDLRMDVTMTAEDGQSTQSAVTLRRVGAEAVRSGADSAGTRDARLVGHWLHTETRASPQLSYATDTHLVLIADGTLLTWRKTVSSLSGTEETAHTGGAWKTEGGALWLKDDGDPEWIPVGKFSLTDAHLVFTNARGERTIYDRAD